MCCFLDILYFQRIRLNLLKLSKMSIASRLFLEQSEMLFSLTTGMFMEPSLLATKLILENNNGMKTVIDLLDFIFMTGSFV